MGQEADQPVRDPMVIRLRRWRRLFWGLAATHGEPESPGGSSRASCTAWRSWVGVNGLRRSRVPIRPMSAWWRAMASPAVRAAREGERNVIAHSRVFAIVTEEKPGVE